MGVCKHNKRWRYDFTHKGNRYTGAGYETKAQARQAETKRREEVNNPPKQVEVTDDLPFEELIRRRLEHVQAYNTQKYAVDIMYMAKRWLKLWKGRRCAEINHDMIQTFVIGRAKKYPYAANKDIRLLRAMFNLGVKKRWIKGNPTDGIEFFPTEKRVKYVPASEDIDKVIAQADQETQDYLWVIRETFARMGEVNHLTWEDVNLQARYVILYTRKKKGGHRTPRKVPMTNKLHEVLARREGRRNRSVPWVFWHRSKDANGKAVIAPYQDRKKIMKRLCKMAGVRYFRFHALRHSGASVLDGENVSIGTIQRLLGHENRTTTEIYLHSLGAHEYQAMQTFEKARQKVTHGVTHKEKGVTGKTP